MRMTSRVLSVVIGMCLLAVTPRLASAQSLTSLYWYYNYSTHDFFYTTDYSELGAGDLPWAGEGVMAYVYNGPADGTKPVYRYNSIYGFHFYTDNFDELGYGDSEWTYEGIQCYVETDQVDGTVPLYRYFNTYYGDHQYTTDGSLGGDWELEGIVGYVFTSGS